MPRTFIHLLPARLRFVAIALAAGLAIVAGLVVGTPAALAAPGDSWVQRTPPVADQYWRAVAFGEGLFVAVAANQVMTSSDGVTWKSRSAPSGSWAAVTYGGGQFVAVANNGGTYLAMTSPDGISWTGRPGLDVPTNWTGVSFGAGKFVAVGEQWVAYSPDGISWTESQVVAPGPVTVESQWSSVTYGASTFVAVAKSAGGTSCTTAGGVNCVITSSDGVTWAAASATSGDEWNAVTYGGATGSERFVAVAGTGSDRVMTSANGTTWVLASSPAATNYWQSITYGAGQFVAVGFGGGVMTSPDGSAWTPRTSGNTALWNAVTAGPQYVAVGQSSGESIMSSFIYAAPTVTGVSPASGPSSGATSVTIVGTGFLDGAKVKIGGTPCTGVAVTSLTHLTCKTGAAAAGKAGVVVTNPDSQSGSLAGAYTYEAVPSPGKHAQTAANGCVTAAGGFDAAATKRLMRPDCRTTAGKRVGLKASANRRGDQVYYRLFCRLPALKTTQTRSTGRGDGSRYCANGSLRIRALASGLILRVTWSAPQTNTFKPYKKVKTYRID